MKSPILSLSALGFPWACLDPFLFCVYHADNFPKGNEGLGPAAPLEGREIGQDFANKDGWNMYHGQVIPGFPQHPHRGFETVTVVRRGLIDHFDSLKAVARYGEGDTQWLTTGSGIAHSEMFPLLKQDQGNPVELFQIWLNLPPKSKMAKPNFTMLWASQIPKKAAEGVEWTLIAGAEAGMTPPSPPPDSWASQAGAEVAIWTLKLEPGAKFRLPAGKERLNRALYYFKGKTLKLDGQEIAAQQRIVLQSDLAVEIENGPEASQLLMLQGKPIAAPVASYGPFVMNTQAELMQAFEDYRQTEFGGWPWPDDAPVHPRAQGRFARHPDGKEEKP